MGIDFKAKRTVACQLQIQDELELHEKLFSYHLAAFNRSISSGLSKVQDEQLQVAAHHAAIVTCLKGMLR